MMLKFLAFLSLLLMLTIQGCAPSPYRRPTPYYQPPDAPRVREQPELQGAPESPAILPQGSIVQEISTQADRQMRQGELAAAAQTLERGLRIAPKDAYLWSQLAAVRLRQGRYGQAQSLAAKSSSLAQGNRALISRNQSIINEAGGR